MIVIEGILKWIVLSIALLGLTVSLVFVYARCRRDEDPGTPADEVRGARVVDAGHYV